MAISQVQIVNMSLSQLGVTDFIASMDEASIPAQVASVFYEPTRDFALADVDWPFASRQIRLGLLDEVEQSVSGAFADAFSDAFNTGQVVSETRTFINTSTKWTYAYMYPHDCLRFREICPQNIDYPMADQRILWDIGSEKITDTGIYRKVIYTDEAAAVGRFTARVTDPTMWSPSFVIMFVWLLASHMAVGLTAIPGAAQQAGDQYRRLREKAIADALKESQDIRPENLEPEMLRYRNG